jgi:hypothetical protein
MKKRNRYSREFYRPFSPLAPPGLKRSKKLNKSGFKKFGYKPEKLAAENPFYYSTHILFFSPNFQKRLSGETGSDRFFSFL